jgi:ankyrin repeat protein
MEALEAQDPVNSMKKLPVVLLHAKIFPDLSMQELVDLARLDTFCKNAVQRYFRRIIRAHALPEIQKQLLNAIQSNNIEKLQGVLNNPEFTMTLLDPVGGFDPLLYANLNGFKEILDAIYEKVSELAQHDPALLANFLKVHIRTSTYFSDAIVKNFELAIAAPTLSVNEALDLACQFGRREVVNYLCKKHGPMRLAIQAGALERVQELIAFGAKPSGVNDPLTGIPEVIRAVSLSVEKKLLRGFGIGLHNPGAYEGLLSVTSGHLPLNFYEEAIRWGQNNVAKYLVDLSMDDITSLGLNNGRVFAVACKYDNTEMLRYLLEKTEGLRDKINLTAVDEAVGHSSRTALQHACIRGNAEAVALLLDNGFPEDARTLSGTTALHFACAISDHKKAIEIAGLLLEKNATPGFLDEATTLGKTALFRACEAGNGELAHLLVNKGASPLRLLDFPGFRFGLSEIFKIRIFSYIFSFVMTGINPLHMVENRMGAIADPVKRIMLEKMLLRYIEDHPNNALAKHLLNSLKGQASPLTSIDKARLAVTGFFAETQLCLIYKFAQPFIEAAENNNNIDAENEAQPLLSPQTVRAQLGLEEVVVEQGDFEEVFTHTEDNTMWGSPRADRGNRVVTVNVNNNNNDTDLSVSPKK